MARNPAQIRIAVFGGSQCPEHIYEKARQVGRLLAQKGILVYCGGMTGVMEAVSRGVREGKGSVVGILPESDSESANPYVNIPVATGAGSARNAMIVNSVHGAIAIDGQYGTLSEIGHALRAGKPVVGLDTWEIVGVRAVSTPEQCVEKILELI